MRIGIMFSYLGTEVRQRWRYSKTKVQEGIPHCAITFLETIPHKIKQRSTEVSRVVSSCRLLQVVNLQPDGVRWPAERQRLADFRRVCPYRSRKVVPFPFLLDRDGF